MITDALGATACSCLLLSQQPAVAAACEAACPTSAAAHKLCVRCPQTTTCSNPAAALRRQHAATAIPFGDHAACRKAWSAAATAQPHTAHASPCPPQPSNFLQALTCTFRQLQCCSSCVSAAVDVGRPSTSCAASDTFKLVPSMSTKCSQRSRSMRDGLSLPLNSNLKRRGKEGNSRGCLACARQQQSSSRLELSQQHACAWQSIAGTDTFRVSFNEFSTVGSQKRNLLSPRCLM